MTPRARLAALLVSLGLVAGGVAWKRDRPSPAPAPGPRRLACAFLPGSTLAYRLEVAPSLGDAGEGDALRATLRLTALERTPRGEWVLAGRVEPTSGFEAPERLLAPFALRVGRNCRFEAWGWAQGATAAQADAITRLLSPFEVVLGDGPVARWSSGHRDEHGAWLSDYEARSWALAGPEISRSAGEYYQRDTASSVEQVALSGRFTLDPEGRWLTTLRGSSHHRVRSEGGTLDVRLDLSLDRVPTSNGPPLPTRETLATFQWQRPREAHDDPEVAHRARLARAREQGATLATLSAEEALARALSLFDGDQDPMHERAYQHLLAWLLARESAPSELWALLRARRTEPRMEALLFLALEQSDTPGARRVLIDALQERGITSMNRQRASLSLASLHTPTREALVALTEASRAATRGEEATQERGVALRSLGLLAGDAVPRELSDEARGVIREALASRDEVTRRGGLDAAGNARSMNLLPEVRAALDDRDPATRASAAHAMRGMERETVQPLLASRLAREEDRAVRHELASTLAENAHGVYDEATVRAASDALARSPEAAVRAQLIRLLGAAVPTRPSAREALAAWVQRETVPELIQLIGQYLDLETMREALRRRAAAPPDAGP